MQPAKRKVHISFPVADWDVIAHEAVRRNTTRSAVLLDLAGPGIAAIRRSERVRHLLNPGGAA